MKTTIYKAGVLFCGGCNPTYDRMALFRKIQECFNGSSGLPAVSFDFCEPHESYDLIVLINGCGSECLLNENYAVPVSLIRSGDLSAAQQSILRSLQQLPAENT